MSFVCLLFAQEVKQIEFISSIDSLQPLRRNVVVYPDDSLTLFVATLVDTMFKKTGRFVAPEDDIEIRRANVGKFSIAIQDSHRYMLFNEAFYKEMKDNEISVENLKFYLPICFAVWAIDDKNFDKKNKLDRAASLAYLAAVLGYEESDFLDWWEEQKRVIMKNEASFMESELDQKIQEQWNVGIKQ